MPNSRRSIAQIIRHRPLAAFFIFSIAFTWIVILLMVGLLGLEDYTFGLIAGFGPTLSAIIIHTTG